MEGGKGAEEVDAPGVCVLEAAMAAAAAAICCADWLVEVGRVGAKGRGGPDMPAVGHRGTLWVSRGFSGNRGSSRRE